MEFKVNHWQLKLIYTFEQYKVLGDMIHNKTAMASFLDSVSKSSKDYNLSLGNDWNDDLIPNIEQSFHVDVKRAFSHYSSMMIVSVATIVEAMVAEFFTALFAHKPNSMHRYLTPGESGEKLGRVSLGDILKHTDIDSLKLELAKKSAKNASNGNFSTVIARVKELTKIEYDSKVVKDIEQLMSTRHTVVHEAASIDVKLDELEAHFDNAELLLKYLGKCCVQNGIAYEDQAFLITEYPAFEAE
ncbi:hypothetical protein V3H21_22340 [Vibrio parahaemolyticus]|uniref:hypothetical protein n=1 Tax=Vibrio parahaemolyticus TaxID=670 RepID=UPI0030F0C5F7|nr:hypothetical protein [Vibrio parahaemolyticus]HCE3663622.1 hypothetical protein [Vibrio parahaemolyticus]HCG5126740.1 hypothetical protein [Vibrio parahaemolyticus]HCG5595494.1 hypothetical protein [Vibrio parahaemolyticus]HCG6499200.1 hypothetical protein [Vibrio parahaemolyticus]